MWNYRITTFLTGAAVMIAEIGAARALAPYFGTSIVVWTNIIGSILVALSVGYWIGGRWAERCPDRRCLGGIIMSAGALLLLPGFATPLIARGMIGDTPWLGSGFTALLFGSLLVIVLLFVVPIALLGMVSPFVLKLAARERSDIGAIAGQLYAISTIGSLVGTFLPTLVLLPTLGTRRTVLAAATLLLVLGAAQFVRRRVSVVAVGVVGLLLIALPEHPPAWWGGGTVIAAVDSPYQFIRVVDHPRIAYGSPGRALVFNEGLSTQSLAVRSGDALQGYFAVAAALPGAFAEQPVSVLILGNAGGTVGAAMQQWFPKGAVEITGVEIDPAVTALARATFAHFPEYPIAHTDSRVFLERNQRQYDLILVDAYTNQLTIPSHLVTREFFQLLQRRLTPRGFIAMNINAPRADSPLLQILLATVADVFPRVTVGHAGTAWNYLVTGSDAPIAWERLPTVAMPEPSRASVHAYLAQQAVVHRNDVARKLTDDWAPIELMTDAEVFTALRMHRE